MTCDRLEGKRMCSGFHFLLIPGLSFEIQLSIRDGYDPIDRS
jgi:hypothetical protein